jgi:hypothetical protein
MIAKPRQAAEISNGPTTDICLPAEFRTGRKPAESRRWAGR